MARHDGSGALGPADPAVRGAYMRLFVAHVDRLPRRLRSAVHRAIRPEISQSIRGAGTFTWLPLEVNLQCTHAVGEHLSPTEMQEFFRTLLLDTTRSPLLHGFVEGVLRVAVRDPSLYLVWVAKGYQLLFRNVGSWEVRERGPGLARLALRDLPRRCLEDHLWLDSLRGGLSSLFDLKQLEGTIEIPRGATNHGVVFEIRWS